MTHETPTPDYGEPWVYDIDYDMALTKNGSVCDANRAVACVNACAGMADPTAEIESMRAAIREAHDSLHKCSRVIGAPKTYEWADEDVCDAAYNSAQAALAKLTPFIPNATNPQP